MQDQIQSLITNFEKQISEVKTTDDIEQLRVSFLGKKGQLTDLLKSIATLSDSDKKNIGALLHNTKETLINTLDSKRKTLEEAALDIQMQQERIDFSLPGKVCPSGSMHPVTLVINEVVEIFSQLGFSVAEGSEIETDYYNFGALNFADDHPARDMHDTFYLDFSELRLLRTHTSGVQIHVMEAYKPPVRVIMPGRVFRSDADVSHSPVFHQVEGLYVDTNVSFSHLKGVLQYFFDRFFQKDSKIRLRPSFFPFTEPSVEVDVECVICKGKGCPVCKQSGWLEILGAGMVDPNVLAGVGLDPDVYSGLAFGVGVERLAMLKYGIDNIKLFFDNHLRFMEQFK